MEAQAHCEGSVQLARLAIVVGLELEPMSQTTCLLEDLAGWKGEAFRKPGLENVGASKRAESSCVTQEPWGKDRPCPYMSCMRGREAGHTNDTLAIWGQQPNPPGPAQYGGSLIPSVSVGRWISIEKVLEKPIALSGVGSWPTSY